jgi:hypothetical protein
MGTAISGFNIIGCKAQYIPRISIPLPQPPTRGGEMKVKPKTNGKGQQYLLKVSSP